MAGAGNRGLHLSSANALFLSAVFIILSGETAEGRQCYWCGPLAEQVHRSRRAPTCSSAAHHVTICEPGFDHCAIVATSPPYLESRFCVKLYQDECYPLFCNSTKTWKMTCPCRGDLCNGVATEREDEAFAALSKLIAKTHSRIKKRTIQMTSNRNKKIVNPDEENPLLENKVEENISQENIKEADDLLTTNTYTESPVPTSEHSTVIENTAMSKTESPTSEQKESELNSAPTVPVMIEIDIVQKPLNIITSETTLQDKEIQADEPDHQNDQPEVAISNSNVDKDEDKDQNDLKEIKEENKIEGTTIDSPTLLNTDISITNITISTKSSVNAEDKMETDPTIEISGPKIELSSEKPVTKVTAQANEDHTEASVTLPTTIASITTNTLITKVTTTTPSLSKMKNKNYAFRLSKNGFFIIYCLLLSILI